MCIWLMPPHSCLFSLSTQITFLLKGKKKVKREKVNIKFPIKVPRFGHCGVPSRDKQQRECCDEIKHEDKLPSSAPSQPCLLNKHWRLDSLELQSLHPESPIDPPDVFHRARGEKTESREKIGRDGETEEGEKKRQPERQAEYMAPLIRSEQQFTCLFKFILACKATVTAPGEKSPPR